MRPDGGPYVSHSEVALEQAVLRVLREYGGSIPGEDLPEAVSHYEYGPAWMVHEAAGRLMRRGLVSRQHSDSPYRLVTR